MQSIDGSLVRAIVTACVGINIGDNQKSQVEYHLMDRISSSFVRVRVGTRRNNPLAELLSTEHLRTWHLGMNWFIESTISYI